MDRNFNTMQVVIVKVVALRKESVDRNARKIRLVAPDVSSLSARRAWIEILTVRLSEKYRQSLSARRAWIEIAIVNTVIFCITVALRKESVDRNAEDWLNACTLSRRSPQGERG